MTREPGQLHDEISHESEQAPATTKWNEAGGRGGFVKLGPKLKWSARTDGTLY